MPLFFCVIMAFFPAGLVLYWVVNNLFSFAQQFYAHRKYGTPGGAPA
jgi:YidC/Oxa1 family membrane protein insertase